MVNGFDTNWKQTLWAHWTKDADLPVGPPLRTQCPAALASLLQSSLLASGGENKPCLLIFYLEPWTTGPPLLDPT